MDSPVNAKEELLSLISTSGSNLKGLYIYTDAYWSYLNEVPNIIAQLNLNYTQEEYEAVLAQLDFTYDAGYGSQYLFGTIWFTDGTWAERGEYDGCEWWERKVCPPIPE